jgi:CNT family concentrative nucleoside transporter
MPAAMPTDSPTAGTPLSWRIGIAAGIAAVVAVAYLAGDVLGPRGRAALGVPCFIAVAALFSANLRRVNWRTVAAGFALQLALALLILKVEPVYDGFRAVGAAIQKFLDFTDEGTRFLFGPLAEAGPPRVDGHGAVGGGPAAYAAAERTPGRPFIFALKALPAVIFVSSFFTVLYYLGVLQFVVRQSARVVVWVMGTSGAETLSAVANVFMGQTEAPLIVKPYVARMTRSELLALMVGGMATIAGGVMVAYVAMLQAIGLGEKAVAILATTVMAAPAGLYLAKILMPETEVPETRGRVTAAVERTQANLFDAAAEGASEGMKLVLNIAAMLIAFIALIALVNHVLGWLDRALDLHAGLTLELIFARLFGPVAYLMGVPDVDVPKVAELLGTKLALNEFVAYTVLTEKYGGMDRRSIDLAVFALTGFANFASVGIQLGGIGALPREPAEQAVLRARLARLAWRALLGGFLATVINAAVAGVLLDPGPTG